MQGSQFGISSKTDAKKAPESWAEPDLSQPQSSWQSELCDLHDVRTAAVRPLKAVQSLTSHGSLALQARPRLQCLLCMRLESIKRSLVIAVQLLFAFDGSGTLSGLTTTIMFGSTTDRRQTPRYSAANLRQLQCPSIIIFSQI